MSWFTSPRERRLWGWTLLVVLTIYATLGLARTLADRLAGSGLDVALFILGCLLVLAAIFTQGLQRRPGRAELAAGLGITAVYLLLFARMTIPTERSHLVEYGVVALLIFEALSERSKQGRAVPLPGWVATLAAALIGLVDELIQALLPSRVFDVRDIAFNGLAAGLAVGSTLLLRWVHGWGGEGSVG